MLMLFCVLYAVLLPVGMLYVSRRHNKTIDWRLAGLYMSFMALGGPTGEIIVGTLYETVFGQPLWQYQFYPIHSGYTSYIAPIIWGLSGGILYISHELIFARKKYTTITKAAYTMIETILVELLINLSVLVLAGKLLFYYTPGDLWHVTSLQTLPFYFLLGLVVDKAMERFRNKPGLFSTLFLSITTVVVIVAS